MTPAIRQTVGEARPGGVTEVPVAVPPGVTEPRERTAADVLRAAARYIEEHGWETPTRHPGGLARCAYLAIDATGGDACGDVSNLFGRFLGGRDATFIWAWNDDPDRTEAEVIAALRSAAAAAADGSAS